METDFLQEKIIAIEKASKVKLSKDYKEWLLDPVPISKQCSHVLFELDEVMQTQKLIQDVLPPGSLAIGDDGYGNQILLLNSGFIHWWDHERELGNHETELLSNSFQEYLAMTQKV